VTKIETVAEEYVACVGVVEEEKLRWFESFGVGKYQFGVTMSRKNAWKVMSHLKNQSTKSAFLSIGETSVQTFFKDLPPEGCDPETAVAQHQSLLQRLFSAAYEIQQLQQDAEAGTRGLHN